MSKPLTLADKLYALSQENAKKYQEPAQPTPTKAATPTQPQETAEEKAARERFETSMRLNSLNNTLSGMQFQETAEELDQAFGDIRSKAKNHLGLDIPPAQYNIVADKITGKSKAEEAEPPQLETNPFSYSIGDAAKRMHEFNEATKKYEEDTKQYRDFAEQANELVTPEKESFWEKLARLGAGIASPTTGAAFTTNIPSKKTEPHYTERLDQATKDYVATLEYDEDGKVIVDGLAIPEEDVLRSLSPSVEGAAYPTLMRDINYRDDQAKRQGYASWNDLIDATYGARLAAIKENVMAEEVKGGGRNSFYTLFREEAAGSRAVRNLEDTIDAMKKGTFWSGFDEGFDTRSALTFGLTGLFSDIDLLRVQNKAKDGVPLTRQEQNILDLFAIKQDLEDVDKLTGVTSARSIGQSVGYTTELMAQFPLAMNLAGGITKAIPMLATNSLKGSARWAVTRRAFQHGVMKGIAKGTSNLLGMGGTALLNLGKMQVVGGIASLAMPSTYANYVQARQKQFTIKDGKLTYTPTSAWTDFYNTIIDSSSEIASELAGQYIQNIADLTFGKFGRMLGLNLIRPSAAWRKVTQDLSFSGMVGEPLSEIWGDITSNVLKMGITGDGDLSMLSDPEYWKKAFAVSMIYGGGMTLASVPSRIMTYTQIQDLGKQKKELLAKVEEQDLYDELVMLSTDESVTQAAQRLAKFFAGKRAKGEKITTDQLAVAMDYIRTEAVLQVAMGINEQSEYMGEFSKAAEGLVARVYCGEDGTTPHRAIVQVTDSTTGKTYDVVSGNVKDVTTGDDLLMVRDADGNKMTLAKGKNLKKSVKNLDTLIAEEFESMFSMPSALDKIAKAEVAYEQLENPTREKVLEMMKGLGIEVPHEGKILELADGRKVTFVEINERGEFIVEHKGADGITSEMLVAPFTQIISSADHIAQAQRHIAGQKIVDMARKEIIAEEVAESTPETTTEATTPTEVTTPQTGAKHKVGEIIDTPNGKARVVAIEGGSYVVDFNLANTSFDDEVMEHGEYSIEEIDGVTPAEAEEAPIQRGVFTLLNPPEEAEATTPSEVAPMETPQAVEEAQNEVAGIKAIPKNEDGTINYDAIDDPKLYADTFADEIGSREEAAQEVANMRDNIIADIEALEKKKKKSKSASETIANKNAIESAKARVAFFDAVLNELTPAEVVEETTTPTEVAEEVAPAKAEEAPIQRGVFTLLNPPEEAEDAERRESVMDPIERAAMEGESTPTAPKTTSTAPVATTAEVGLVKNELSGKLVGRLQKTIDGLAKAMGVSVEFVDEALFTTSGKGRVNAKIEGNKVIISWKDRARAIRFLIGHEFTHRMKKLSTEAYEAFEKSVINALGEKEWNKRVERMRKAYEAVKESISENDLYEEVVADYVGDMAYSDNYFDKWAEANKEKHWLLEWVSEIWQKLADWFKSFGDNGMAQRMRDMHTKLDALVASAEEAQAEIAEREGTTPITSMTDAAANSKPAVQYSISTEGTLQEQIREYAYTKEGMLAGWTPEKVEGIIEETSALITALDAALRGNSFYDAFADRQPTIRTDWRDGQLKPTVTWTRANIEYKYDMSADLLCINNDGIESVLTSPSMVALMNMLTPAKVKDKNKVYDMRMTASDYTLLYDIMRSMGYVVPCKGCFDAAGRFKMLPSVAQKFIQDVNDAVDERNKDPKKFDAAVRKGKGKNTAVSEDGTPVTGATKDEAIRVAVMGDKLTHHLNWYDLITAEGQTNMLANHGGIFRAWQKTGAGRPKDKLLAEPYIGDITSSTTTIIGAYGDKTPSFRAIEVNQGTGLRRNSHSEFRPVLAVDEIQFMRDAFLRGLTVFKYMKELDDVRLFGKMGVKFNMSFFPAFVKGTKVAGLDANGNYIASEESVGAREFPYKTEDGVTHYDGEKGFEEAQKHINEDVSLSSVIFSIPHLIKAMTDVPTPKDKNGIWGSLIPFHSSGATTVQLAAQGLGMARANGVGHGFDEAMTDYGKGVTNFEAVQNDRFGEGWTIVAGKKADTKVEAGHKIEFANGNHYYNEAKGVHLFTSGYVLDSELTDKEKKALMGASKVAKDLVKRNHLHDFVVDYNDKVREIGTEYAYKEAADYYMGKLRELGLVPRFEFAVDEQTFLQMCEDAKVDPRHPKLGWKGEGNGWSPTDADSYYALFCDYGMTDPATGKWSPHRPVGVINENGERVFQMPENTIDIVKEGLERYTKTRAKEDSMNNAAVQAFADAMVEQGRLTEAQVAEAMGAKYSVIGEIGTLALDKAEEATTRLDDLNVARQMEERGDSAVETKDIGEMPEPDDTHTSEKTNFSLITPEMDADYLSAVERGDMEKAQQMVMEAAKLAMPNTKVVDEDGNPKVVYHGTPNNFNAFSKEMFGTSTDRGIWGNGFYFSDSEQYAKTYEKRGDKQGKTLSVFLNIKRPLFISLRNGGNEGAMYFHELMEKHFTDDIYEDVTRTDELMSVAQERLTADIVANGYDGIVVEYTNHIDTEYVAFEPNQIKSADPVTYDDAGNIIPLSERFNPEKEDIRYSLSEETAQIFDAAKAKFGTTYDMREAGYILPDGSMLDFSGRHQVRGGDTSFLNGDRTVDHREISDIAYDADDNETGISTDLGDFLDRGAIRIDSNAGAINLNVAPTKAQKDRLKRLIERNDGYVYVDFGKGWDTEHYAEYEAARASRVLGDIDRYFDEGIKPTGNIRYSLSYRPTGLLNDFAEEFETLQMEYESLYPTTLHAHHPFRIRKRKVVQKYLNYVSEVLALPCEIFVLDSSNEQQVRTAYRKYVASRQANGKIYTASYEEFKEEVSDAIGEFFYGTDMVFINIGVSDAVNINNQYLAAALHENGHKIIESMNISNEMLEAIYEEAQKLAPQQATRVDRLYGDRPIAERGEEIVTWGLQSRGSLTKTKDLLMQFFEDKVSETDILNSFNFSLPLRDKILKDTLIALRDGYNNKNNERTNSGGDNNLNGETTEGTIWNGLRGKPLRGTEGGRLLNSPQYSLNTDMPFFEDNGDIVIFDELTAEEQKMARLEEAKALLDDNEDAQSIYDKTGWVYTEDGWEYFGEADIALNDNEKEKQRARRWLQAKRAVAKSRVRTMTKDLVDDIVAEERVKNEEEFAAIDEQNELREKNEKKLKYPLSEEAKAKIDELYKERNNTLAEIDKEYRDIFERFEADPKPYIQDYYASEAMMSDLDMFNGTVVKLKKSLDRAMRKIAQGKADRKSKMEATKAIKAQVNEMLRGELSRYTRKRDIVVLMDAVNEAKTVYQMLRAFNKAVETLYNIRLRKEMARMMSLTKMRLILNESGSSIDPQTYIKRMVADGVLTTAMAQNILNNYWRGVNSTGINIAKGVDADTVEVMTFIHKNVGLEGLAGKGVAEKIQELTDAVDKSNDSEAMKAMKMQAIAIIEDYLIAQMQMQSLKEIKNERDIEAEIARYSAEIAKLNNELINLEEQRDAIIETDKGFKSRKTAIEQKLKEIRTKYAEAVKQREQLDATYYGAMPDILKRMAEANESLELLLKRGHLRLSARKQAEVDHRNELVRMAVDDIDRPDALLRDNPKYGVGQKAVGSWVGKMVTKAYGSMEHMLRRVARNAPNGEGKLWHYFAKRLNNAYNNMIDAQKECADIVNGKCMELFGKKYNKVMQKAEDTIIGTYLVPNPNIANDKSLPRFKRVSPSHVEKDLSVAQALYIVSMWNQADGMATLIEQGFTEEKIEEIKEGLNKNNPKWLEFQKWVVGTFLPSRRGKYNDTHRMLFGADMDNVVNYYPIRRNMNDVRRNDDLSSPDFQNMPSTSTGSIIKRTNSKIKIDLEASFFGVLQEHIIEMEKWAEMAPVTKDFNALLSSKMVQTLMNGVGENFLEEFKNAAKVATLNYADHAREMEAILAPLLSRMWGAGLIGFKPYTALKQLTSSVLFFTHSIDPRFVGRFAFYLAGGALPLPSNVLGRIGTGELKIFPQGDWAWNIQWALQNSAMFRQRWESLAAGNEVFAKELLYSKDTSKFKKAITEGIAKLSKGSMALIALVDAYTSAAGMRAIYDDVYNTLIKDGATHEMAHEEALFRAELAVNKTQQSSQFMYLSPMQVSSDLVNTSLSAFQNAPIAQGRMFAESVAELVRNPREEARWIRHKYEEKLKEGVLAKEYAATEAQIEAEKAEGLLTTEEDVQRRRDELNRVLNLTARTMAERKAKKAVAKNKFKAGLNAVITGYLATLVFNLTAQLPYLLWGDDDDEKKKMLKDTLKWSFAGPLASVPLLGRLVNLAQGYGFELSGSLESFQKDLNSMADHIEKSGVDIDFALMALDFASRKGLGIDYKTIYSIYSGFEDMARNGYSKEAMMRAMVVPNSQVKLLVGERKEGETQKEYYTRIMRLYDIFTEEEYGAYFDEDGKPISDHAPQGMTKAYYKSLPKQWEAEYRKNVVGKRDGYAKLDALNTEEEEYKAAVEALGWTANKNPNNKAYEGTKYTPPIEGLTRSQYNTLSRKAKGVATKFKQTSTYKGNDDSKYYELLMAEMEAKKAFVEEYKKVLNSI